MSLLVGGHETGYTPLPNGEDTIQDEKDFKSTRSRSRKLHIWYIILGVILVILSLVASFAAGAFFTHLRERKPTCEKLVLRREWRSLANIEKQDYIRAVQCLAKTPSHLGLNQTLYHDFPTTHYNIGGNSHESALFLAWHRYFIHIYEKALREQCNYKGHLAYWDWTLDWEDITQSPIWNNEIGFGGNGSSAEDTPSAIRGGCVEGPFAGIEIQFYNETYGPHCLSRGFADERKLKILGRLIKPSTVDRVLRSTNYNRFNLNLELGPHNAIPLSIQGDFGFFTAPADPVFFLHHTQLDRLWWKWQQADLNKRLTEYMGKAAWNSDKGASLDDVIFVGDLAPETTVSEMMDTESGQLCYRY